MRNDKIKQAQSGIEAIARGLQIEPEQVRDRFRIAITTLAESWVEELGDRCQRNLADDVTGIIGLLEVFQANARRVLPIANGGFGGHCQCKLVKGLKSKGIDVYENDDGSCGYTGCNADAYDNLDEALVAALKANPDLIEESEAESSLLDI